MRTTLPPMPLAYNAPKQPVKFGARPSQPVKFGADEPVGPEGPSGPGALKKWLKRAGIALGVASAPVAVVAPFSIHHNPPGTHSLVWTSSQGTLPQVHDDGMVVAFPYFQRNQPYDTTYMGIRELLTPGTFEGPRMRGVTATVVARLNPDRLFHTQTQLLQNRPAEQSNTSIFEKDNPALQQAYLTYARVPLRAAINEMFAATQAEGLHLRIAQMQRWLRDGVDLTYKANDGTERRLKFPPMAEVFAQYGMQLHNVVIAEIGNPPHMEQLYMNRALASLTERRANLEAQRDRVAAETETAKQRIQTVTAEETAQGDAAKTTLERELNVQIAQLDAEIAKINAEKEANYAAAEAETNRLAEEIIAAARAEAQRTAANATATAARLAGEGDAQYKIQISRAEAEALRAQGVPLRDHPVLLRVVELEQRRLAALGLANNPNLRVVFVDRDTGVDMDIVNVGPNASTMDLPGIIAGQSAANRATQQPAAPATPPAGGPR